MYFIFQDYEHSNTYHILDFYMENFSLFSWEKALP